MKQTAAYYRSSSKLQEESVASQKFNVSQFAVKHGHFIDKEYPDPYVSARKNSLYERPQMNQLIQDIKNGKIGRLLVYKRDRLARKIEEHLELYYLFKGYEVKVLFAAENEPPMNFDVFGELMELFIGVMNQREGEQILERIMDSKLGNFLSGKTNGNLPFGYKVKNGEITKMEDELDDVKKLFDEWNNGDYKNLSDFVQRIPSKGLKRGHKNWTYQNAKGVLTNPIYMGSRVANFQNQQQTRFINNIDCIEPNVYYKAQELLLERTQTRSKRKPYPYLLTDLLFCSESKKTLVEHVRIKNGSKYSTYECRDKDHPIILNAEETEEMILDHCIAFFKSLPKEQFSKLYNKQLKKNLKQIKSLRLSLQGDLERAEERLLQATSKWLKQNNRKNKETLLERSKAVNAIKSKMINLEEYENELKDVPFHMEEVEESVLSRSIWMKLSVKEKQDLIRDIVKEIMVSEKEIHIVLKHPFLEALEVRA